MSTTIIPKQIKLLAISGALPVRIPEMPHKKFPILTKYLTLLADFISIPDALKKVATQPTISAIIAIILPPSSYSFPQASHERLAYPYNLAPTGTLKIFS